MLPAIAELDATGETAEIFADLRATLGVPFVNLIWRHLATIPGLLPWTWSVVEPLHRSAELGEAAAELLASIRGPGGLGRPVEVFEAAGIDIDARAAIAELVRYYNRSNSLNLLTLLVVRCLLDGRATAPTRTLTFVGRSHGVAPRAPGVPLSEFATLTPALQELVLELDQFGRTASSSAVASLYIHLTHWPGFLGLLRTALEPSHRSGLLRAAHVETLRHARVLVRRNMLPGAFSPPLPEEPGRSMALAGVEQFTTQMIARMVTIGTLILKVLPGTDERA